MTGERIHTHVLEGDTGIKVATRLSTDLLDALENHDQIHIDTQAISAADLTTVQTLLATRISAEARGKNVLIAAPLSSVLLTVLNNAGLLAPGQDHQDFWSTARRHQGA
jgi:ABC-type transporter Mla MlaB component